MDKRSATRAWRSFRIVINTPRILPHYLAWRFSSARSLIDQDVQRWREAFLVSMNSPSDTVAFAVLMILYPEFRTLFYHRVGVVAAALRFLCPPMESLILSCDDVGPSLVIQHGIASVIVAERIGSNCWINQQVTLGAGPRKGFPILGDDVRIAPGAKVLGAVRIGDRSIIGANAVVTKDVPPDVTVVGVPAYIMRRNGVRVHEPL